MDGDFDPSELTFDAERDNYNDEVFMEEVVENAVDYSEHFTTTTVFRSRKELIDWVIQVGKMFNMVIIIARSEGGEGQGFGKAKATLTCERSGKYRLSKSKNLVDVEKFTGTKKMLCPFRLQAKEHFGGGWSVVVRHGMHNHKLPEYNEGRAIIGRMTKEELSLVKELTRSHVLPNQIMDILRTVNENTLTTVKHVYNARQKFKMELMEGRTVMQQLMKLLVDNEYMQWHREEVGTDVVRDIVFAHPNVSDLLKLFPYVLVIDCTYKTNRYKMPFLEVVGIVPTGKNFAIAFAWLKDEQNESYEWVLRCVRELFGEDNLPHAIVTDRDKALMKAVDRAFPNSSHLLCTRHIQKNVENKMGKLTKNKDLIDAFIRRWQRVVEANTISMYHQRVEEMHNAFGERFSAMLKYVKSSWIDPYGDKFLRSHTMNILHFGTRTTNRVESAHATLKSWLKTSTGSLDTIWPKIHSFWELQIREIKAAFQRSQNTDPHVTALRIFMLLKGRVTHKALRLLDKEYNQADLSENEEDCGCYLRKTHGLPCAHEMKKLEAEGRCIQLSDIHPFWKTFKINVKKSAGQDLPSYNFQIRHDIDKVLHSFFVDILGLNEERKKAIASQIEKKIHPEFTTLKQPVVNEQVRGRPPIPSKNSTKRDLSDWEYTEKAYTKNSNKVKGKGTPSIASVQAHEPHLSSVSVRSDAQSSSKGIREGGRKRGRRSNALKKQAHVVNPQVLPYIDDLPLHIVPFISNIYNVDGDGNCGYRVVARWLYGDEHRWPTVRHELGLEIEKRYELFSDAMGSESNANKALRSLSHFAGMTPKSKWMPLFDMGSVIATRYNVVVVCYAINQSMTFFPLIADEGKQSPDRVITFGFLESMEHFVQVEMKEDCPLPPIEPYWRFHHDASVNGWDTPFQSRFDCWVEKAGRQKQQDNHEFVIIDH